MRKLVLQTLSTAREGPYIPHKGLTLLAEGPALPVNNRIECKRVPTVGRTAYISNTKARNSCKRYGKRPTRPLKPSYLGRGPGHAGPSTPDAYISRQKYSRLAATVGRAQTLILQTFRRP